MPPPVVINTAQIMFTKGVTTSTHQRCFADSESGMKSFKLTSLQELGVKKVVQYGAHLKLVSGSQESEENLSKLLRQSGHHLKQQQRQVKFALESAALPVCIHGDGLFISALQIGSHLRSLSHNYVGFDWFTATVYLLTRGNYEQSWRLLQMFYSLAVSAYLWGPRTHRSMHLPANLASSSISPVLFSTCHNIELLLQIEFPLIYSAFRMSGLMPSQVTTTATSYLCTDTQH